jgi:rfaE bifunctional protein nucleotidyltransferase chain/domain
LQEARSYGDALVIAVDSDASVRALAKGEERPLVPAGDRAEVLTALRCVDRVVIFDGPGAMRIIEALRPDVYVKGGDYADGSKPLPEAPVVRSYGGEVRFIDLVPGRSTTDLVRKIRSG